MTRDAFLQELRIALQGHLPQAQVNEHLSYYENYIIEESRKGRTEEEVLKDLGNPRLIAKTLIQTFGGGISRAGHAHEEREDEGTGRKFRFSLRGLPAWLRRLITVLAGIVFVVLLIQIGMLLLPIIAAVFMTGAIVSVMYRNFFTNKK